MIPFGTLAFFAGQLVHTNECLCKMGELLDFSCVDLVVRTQILATCGQLLKESLSANQMQV